mgnify:CR=1 FL=1
MIFSALLGRFWWQIPAALACVTIVLTWDSSRKAKWVETGKREIVQASEKQGAQNAAAAEKAHDTAKRPGAADRLRKDARTCPDCRE